MNLSATLSSVGADVQLIDRLISVGITAEANLAMILPFWDGQCLFVCKGAGSWCQWLFTAYRGTYSGLALSWAL